MERLEETRHETATHRCFYRGNCRHRRACRAEYDGRDSLDTIGYEALMRGDNERAVSQILNSNKISRDDPAKLLNLGRAYARMGRTEEAAVMFAAAMKSKDSVDLVLADGRVMNSKDAARKAYANLQMRVATR